ncbi:hypothetical protein [Streptomyces sp. NPDC050164]|uniref:hypothetical protein n=1 Tax=Streptomyces sp. NPDC050164 TaxID=3365605 RepID=UPI0037B87F25
MIGDPLPQGERGERGWPPLAPSWVSRLAESDLGTSRAGAVDVPMFTDVITDIENNLDLQQHKPDGPHCVHVLPPSVERSTHVASPAVYPQLTLAKE